MENIEYVKCIKEIEHFTVGCVYKLCNGSIRDNGILGFGFDWNYSLRRNSFSKVARLYTPVLKHPTIYFILDKFHIKYDKQYKINKEYKDVEFENYSNITNKIINIYNNINLLYKNKLFQLHSCKIKMMIDSIDTYFKMYNNKLLDDKAIKNIYNILCKYNEFLFTENSYVKDKERKNEDDLKNKSGEILNDILAEQNKKLDSWISDLKDYNK